MADEKRPAHYEFEKVMQWLYELRGSGYYGEIELKLANGHIVAVSPRPLCKPGEELPVVRPRKRFEVAG